MPWQKIIPSLKANENFLKLQIRISELEDRIADRREFFNDDVNTYNTRIGQIPEVFVASYMSLKPRPMFKVSEEDRQLVEVKFRVKPAAHNRKNSLAKIRPPLDKANKKRRKPASTHPALLLRAISPVHPCLVSATNVHHANFANTMKGNPMNNLIRSILKTAVYFLDQTNSFTSDVRDRVSDGVGRVSDRVSDLRDQAADMYSGEDHTVRNVLTFVAGVGVGVGAALVVCSRQRRRNPRPDRR